MIYTSAVYAGGGGLRANQGMVHMEGGSDDHGVDGVVDQDDVGGLGKGEDLFQTGKVGGKRCWWY